MKIQVLDDTSDFLSTLSKEDRAKIDGQLASLASRQTEGLVIKSLKGKIQELIVRQYRIVFFRIADIGYVVDIFRKKSKKTPKRNLERAEKIYRSLNTIT